MAQRLVRVICSYCKRPVELARGAYEESGLDPGAWENVTFYEGAGCDRCSSTGFHGRTAIGELLALTDSVRELILAKKSIAELRRVARKEGMVTLRESALEKVREGLTTLREINKVTFVE